ncbi:MAG: hypothetical protein EZS26_000754 [Candidatus Ordinivivax streblomastigis]|uniref:HNH endonuclease n=1 Tax=Candidatus Ordinivivax streblomastigis TaxID=2540710 RepID=A0A5M8P421_9BACT|nr:MAG: hypothetical protein EZS26_000754 [Candidatus Ordinivivax streblomastigis]
MKENEIIEIWKDIPEYEGFYQASNLGKIKSCKRYVLHPQYGKQLINEKVLKQNLSTTGYYQLLLCKNGKPKRYKTHRVIAQTFIPNPENKPMIDHINGIPTDNRVENLRWVNQTENMNNPIFVKRTSEKHKGKINNHFSIPVIQIDKNHNIINRFLSSMEAQRITGINHNGINRVCAGKQEHAGGYFWKHAEYNSNFR